MNENEPSVRKHRRTKSSYLDGLTFIDGGVIVGTAFGIIVIIIIMLLILIDLYKTF